MTTDCASAAMGNANTAANSDAVNTKATKFGVALVTLQIIWMAFILAYRLSRRLGMPPLTQESRHNSYNSSVRQHWARAATSSVIRLTAHVVLPTRHCNLKCRTGALGRGQGRLARRRRPRPPAA